MRSLSKILFYFPAILLILTAQLLRAQDAATGPAAPTPAAVWTPENSPTPVFTPTPEFSATVTSTGTNTAIFTSTATFTATGTLTPSDTPTPTSTDTHTVTLTPTITSTPTATATSTPGIFQFSVSPKPDGQGQIRFAWGTTVPADEVFLKIYSSGFRIVHEFHFTPKDKPEFLASGGHEAVWDGKDEQRRPMPPGTYLCFINVNVGKKRYEASGKTEIP
jgi:hypothetical protein